MPETATAGEKMIAVPEADLGLVLDYCTRTEPEVDTDPKYREALDRTVEVWRAWHEAAFAEMVTPEPDSAAGDGCFAVIAFMGHNEHTGYVTEILKNGQPAYHVDLPEKLWGGNPLAYVEYAASAWFSERPVSEESVRKAWEAQCRRAALRARQEAEWQRMQDQRVLTDGSEADDDPDDYDSDPDGSASWR